MLNELKFLLKLLTFTTVLAVLSGCQTLKPLPPSQRVVEEICGLFANMTYDGDQDTAETKEQIRKFNARRDKLCV